MPSLPEVAHTVSGQVYTLEENKFGWQSLSLAFAESAAQLSLNASGEPVDLKIGLDGEYRVTRAVRFGAPYYGTALAGPVALRGGWTGEVFALDLLFLIGGTFVMLLEFDGDVVAGQVNDLAGRSETILGTALERPVHMAEMLPSIPGMGTGQPRRDGVICAPAAPSSNE